MASVVPLSASSSAPSPVTSSSAGHEESLLAAALATNKSLLAQLAQLEQEHVGIDVVYSQMMAEEEEIRKKLGLERRHLEGEPLKAPAVKDIRFPVPSRVARKHHDGWYLAQMHSDHFDAVLDIQTECFEPIHCEEVQAYIDRLHLYPEGAIVLALPNPLPEKLVTLPPPTDKSAPVPSRPETLAGYVLAQRFFRGEIHADDDSQGLMETEKAVKEGRKKYDCVYIHELSVHPAFRSKGCSSPLLARVDDLAIAEGVRHISLVALPDATDFWIHQGFKELYKLDYAGIPSIYMEKELKAL
eukprot:TRINITY_DN201_c0_g1_i1.p1 TRINITY_DN201_c0_g1~~TRINITY_DN201_c0_g1_i1.p1  ORF type:complete len:300 (-),score=53.58 TRINITY_DN201_c0_g1_i1:129-1028(-)